MADVSVKSAEGGDFLVHMESQQYNLESCKVVNPATGIANINQVAGTPVQLDLTAKTATLLSKANVTNADGFLIEGPKLTDMGVSTTSEEYYSVLWAGPAVINRTKYNLAAPIAGETDYTATELDTQVAAMPGDIRIVDEPAQTTEQTAGTEYS